MHRKIQREDTRKFWGLSEFCVFRHSLHSLCCFEFMLFTIGVAEHFVPARTGQSRREIRQVIPKPTHARTHTRSSDCVVHEKRAISWMIPLSSSSIRVFREGDKWDRNSHESLLRGSRRLAGFSQTFPIMRAVISLSFSNPQSTVVDSVISNVEIPLQSI